MENKPFDSVTFMRKRREEIDREDDGLSWEEKSRRTLDSLEGNPVWERIKERRMSGLRVPAGKSES
ncbi:MAG: hypothetical protein KC964_03715 [Candidatus Omnitrophica bacterium]|nr:hypothetical protein [Candidatus Omnitrophota bacterium]